MNEQISVKPGSRWKVFLVEEGDDNRERVIAGIADVVEIDYQTEFDEVRVDDLLSSARIFASGYTASLTMKCVPDSLGNLFRLENFMETEEEEYDDTEF